MNPDDMERIKSIKRRHEKRLLALDGVVAVGIGVLSTGDVGLIVSVKQSCDAARKKIPRRLEGILVEVRMSGEIKAQ
jgi:hypothetical protein